jgi:MoaA/NifB/PqqE/SkfB family radical SAM enzyme
MTSDDWYRLLDEAAALNVRIVQFIGGEPMLFPALPALVQHALARGLTVEVYSNLVHVTRKMWSVLEQPGVRLACSYYSSSAAEHDAITGRPSHDRTLANVREALRRGIPIRVGVVDVQDGQDVSGAVAELYGLGIRNVNVDRLREVGRGIRGGRPSVSQLCGRCADGKLAISPNGDVWPCIFSRWLTVGNVRSAMLSAINADAETVRAGLREQFDTRRLAASGAFDDDKGCGPDDDKDPGGDKCDPDYKGCTPEPWE